MDQDTQGLDALAAQAADDGDHEEIRQLLREVCYITKMGFAAVARVTDTRWIAAAVEDRIGFGLKPGGELKIQETICNEVRRCGQTVIIDDVDADAEWSRHPVPRQYGFQSYVSIPLLLADGSFYGTLCAIDPKPRRLSAPTTVTVLEAFATRLTAILSRRRL
jgi:GAF domain-containing protein